MQTMDRVERIAATVGDLPALPQMATKVMSLIQDPSCKVQDLERIISRDQAITARVLRIANSAFYGVRGDVSTLSRAIIILGFNTLRSVVVTGASAALHRTKSSCFKDRILWEHSIAVAIASRTIAKECSYASQEEAYLGGLLHDVGKVVLNSNMSEDYQEVIEQVYNDRKTFIEAENDVLGFNHCDIGALMATRWSLAPALTEAVRLHHQPLGSEIDPTLCAIVSLANSLCVKLGIGLERDAEIVLADLESTLMLTLKPERLQEISTVVKTTLAEEKSLLSLSG